MRLAQIRQSRGLTQEDLGEMVGVNKSTISRAEAMSKTSRLETYIICAQVLGVSLAEIFVESEDEAALVLAYRNLRGPSRDLLMGMAEKAKDLPPPPPGEATATGQGEGPPKSK